MIEIRWSAAHLASLKKVMDSPSSANPIQRQLAPAYLYAASGDNDRAREIVRAVMAQQPQPPKMGGESFSHIVAALFATQQFEFAATLFSARFDLGGYALLFELKADGPQHARVLWQLASDRKCTFVFGPAFLQHDDARYHALYFCWLFPLVSEYLRYQPAEAGEVIINLWDVGLTPGLAGCANSTDFVLIPDWLFISSRGYETVRQAYRADTIPWRDRKSIAFWRGTTTGHPTDQKAGWRSLPRIRLCEMGSQNRELTDFGISQVRQVANPGQVQAEIEKADLFREYVPAAQFNRYRYQIDIDGNTNSWPGLLQKLLTGSTVLKIASGGGYKQWYYDRLVPWHNFVPVADDMSDLVEKIRWLEANDVIAQRIGKAGRAWQLAGLCRRVAARVPHHLCSNSSLCLCTP